MRCFVACWPDDRTRHRLDLEAQRAAARYPQARRVRRESLHLTLAFIGELPLARAREAADALRGIASDPFDWDIDHIGRFERAHVLWAGGPSQPRLSELAERVRAQLQALQIRFDGKRFAAHVTLLRDLPAGLPTIAPGAGVASTEAGRSIAASQAVESIDPFAWPIQAAQLLVSERDAAGATGYRPLDP